MHSIIRLSPLALAATVLLGACGEKPKADAPPAPPADAAVPPAPTAPAADPATVTYGASLAIDLSKMTRTANGLYYRDLVVGTGARADSGKTLSAHYSGYFTDGKLFQTSTTGTPIEFPLGQHRVIQGWDEGIPGMKVGGKRQIIIPPAMGYGDAGSPPDIPGRTILVFTVELMAVK